MSTDFENALIAFGQSLYAKWGDAEAVAECRRKLEHVVKCEFVDTAFGTALLGIIAKAAAAKQFEKLGKEDAQWRPISCGG